MKIKNKKEIEKWARESTLQEIKDSILIMMSRLKTKQQLELFLIDIGESMKRRTCRGAG